MEFPKDHELFSDIQTDGTLKTHDNIMQKMLGDSAYFEFMRVAHEENDKLPMSITLSEKEKNEQKIFKKAAEAAYQYTKGGSIGMFPSGEFEGKRYSCVEDGKEEEIQIVVDVIKQLEKYDPSGLRKGDFKKRYEDALAAKGARLPLFAAIIFLLLNMALVALVRLSLLPEGEQYHLLGYGRDWMIVLGLVLTLILAWGFHFPSYHMWWPLGIAHIIVLFIPLIGYNESTGSVDDIIFSYGVGLIISAISLIHYVLDYRRVRNVVRDFKKWCDADSLEDYRRLRFLTLWYENITNGWTSPFKDNQKEFFSILDKRKNF